MAHIIDRCPICRQPMPPLLWGGGMVAQVNGQPCDPFPICMRHARRSAEERAPARQPPTPRAPHDCRP